MNPENEQNEVDSMRDEYDFRGGVRGKYARRFAQGSNVIVLDEDVARIFKDSQSVNAALREIVRIAEHYRQKVDR
jgi:hypothetical protein